MDIALSALKVVCCWRLTLETKWNLTYFNRMSAISWSQLRLTIQTRPQRFVIWFLSTDRNRIITCADLLKKVIFLCLLINFNETVHDGCLYAEEGQFHLEWNWYLGYGISWQRYNMNFTILLFSWKPIWTRSCVLVDKYRAIDNVFCTGVLFVLLYNAIYEKLAVLMLIG